jgi:tetratricopeptide (TPR) repeat protein
MGNCVARKQRYWRTVLAIGGLAAVTPGRSGAPIGISAAPVRSTARTIQATVSPDKHSSNLSERAFLHAAQSLLRRGEIPSALAMLQKGTALYPRSAALHYLAAGILGQQHDYSSARRQYEAVVKLAPDQIQGYFGLAQVAFAQRDYPASAAALRRAIRLDPHSATAYAKLGRVYTDAFDTPRALQALRKAIELEPQSAEAQFYMGDLLLRMSRLDEAQPYVERAIALAPGNAHFQASLGDLFIQRQESPANTARALAAYQEAIRLDPLLAAAHFGVGRVYARQRLWKRAEQELLATLRISPTFGRAHYTLAQVCRHLGQTAEAAEHLEAFRRFRSRPKIETHE